MSANRRGSRSISVNSTHENELNEPPFDLSPMRKIQAPTATFDNEEISGSKQSLNEIPSSSPRGSTSTLNKMKTNLKKFFHTAESKHHECPASKFKREIRLNKSHRDSTRQAITNEQTQVIGGSMAGPSAPFFNHSSSLNEFAPNRPNLISNGLPPLPPPPPVPPPPSYRSVMNERASQSSLHDQEPSTSISSSASAYMHESTNLEEEITNEIDKLLPYLNTDERLRLQIRGYNYLQSQIDAKRAHEISLRADIDELQNRLQNEQIKTNHDLERLKSEIKELSKENASLEKLVNQNWECQHCTLSNTSETSICQGCDLDRKGEVYQCPECNYKNSLRNTTCINCNKAFDAHRQPIQQQQQQHQRLSPPTNLPLSPSTRPPNPLLTQLRPPPIPPRKHSPNSNTPSNYLQINGYASQSSHSVSPTPRSSHSPLHVPHSPSSTPSPTTHGGQVLLNPRPPPPPPTYAKPRQAQTPSTPPLSGSTASLNSSTSNASLNDVKPKMLNGSTETSTRI